MNDLADPAGIVAIAAGLLALAALAAFAVLAFRMRRLREDQRAVLGGAARQDLVAHAAHLHDAVVDLHERVEEIADGLETRMAVAEERIDGAVAHRALVRYDAYNELSGHQSLSLALLDARHNGAVLSVINHRDTQRFYVKQIVDGQGEHPLSPEEAEAVRRALAGESASVTLDA